mmetsp:Transcript_7151/g.20319  ORF Transcript_7151/g.20319 Transcript_7151/m.20319 type:complete len:212 (+) Transcript_7151:183-818(+)
MAHGSWTTCGLSPGHLSARLSPTRATVGSSTSCGQIPSRTGRTPIRTSSASTSLPGGASRRSSRGTSRRRSAPGTASASSSGATSRSAEAEASTSCTRTCWCAYFRPGTTRPTATTAPSSRSPPKTWMGTQCWSCGLRWCGPRRRLATRRRTAAVGRQVRPGHRTPGHPQRPRAGAPAGVRTVCVRSRPPRRGKHGKASGTRFERATAGRL